MKFTKLTFSQFAFILSCLYLPLTPSQVSALECWSMCMVPCPNSDPNASQGGGVSGNYDFTPEQEANFLAQYAQACTNSGGTPGQGYCVGYCSPPPPPQGTSGTPICDKYYVPVLECGPALYPLGTPTTALSGCNVQTQGSPGPICPLTGAVGRLACYQIDCRGKKTKISAQPNNY